jgi:thioredoxin-related protein
MRYILVSTVFLFIVFGALFVWQYTKPEAEGRKRNLWIFGLLAVASLLLAVYKHTYENENDEHEERMCSYVSETPDTCAAKASYPALVLFKSDGCIHCKRFACTWNDGVARLREANIPVNIYTIDVATSPCLGLKDATVEAVPIIRYYYDAEKYDDMQTDRTPENFANFVKTKITDHISPAGATTAKPNPNVEKYTSLSGSGREGYRQEGYRL